MRICVVGAGYVGLVTGACLAEMGNTVWCIDVDVCKIEGLKNGVLPIYEPGLEELIKRNVKEKRLYFLTDLVEGLRKSLFCFITVGTPSQEDGSADLSFVLDVAQSIGKNLQQYLIVVNKSTVPVGTAGVVRETIARELEARKSDVEFDVVSNPEFLKEGAAIEDFMRPDRIVVGTENVRAAGLMKQLYEPFVRNQHPILVMDVTSAELTKYASNAMLATRISFMNELARLCDKVGADISQVRVGMGTDKRIGMPFLYAGPGYGGSCFPKDVKELANAGERFGAPMELLKVVDQVNDEQKRYVPSLVIKRFGDDLAEKHFALWGLAFKPQTDDMREAPSLVLIRELLERGAMVTAYDPVATEQAKRILGEQENLYYAETMLEAARDKDGLILLTEWRQFRQPDWQQLGEALKRKIIFDGRNIYEPVVIIEAGFEYYGIGRSYIPGRS
ncbi:MAG: UDP-glucose/GDP-mannose dehydrogenase family protein [Negativicutes bacterium]|nr:UDP-glucose/GDP-mannose dehydrogenase family protein [Negativicutes bacterium]